MNGSELSDKTCKNSNTRDRRVQPRPPVAPGVVNAALAVCVFVFSGCQSMNPMAGMFGSKSKDDADKLASTEGIQGPLGRLVSQRIRNDSTSLTPAAGREELDAAEAAFKKGEYGTAEKLAKAVAKKYPNSPVREDALFLKAEAQYEQKAYSWAQDSYDELVKDFPSTRYLEVRNKRLFNIARYWLRDPKYVTSDDVKLTGFSAEGDTAKMQVNAQSPSNGFDVTRTVPILPNFHDRSRPVFDTDGRALQALKSIWQNDPTGALADDALMLTASYHIRNQNYLEADHYLTIIREEYPKSKHNSHAYVLSGFVKQASYQGPEYDPKSLDEAKRLKESTMRLYPGKIDRQRFEQDLRKIEEGKAAADWAYVDHYRKKGNKQAMAIYCREIIRLYPTTSFASKARDLLPKLEERPERRRAEVEMKEPEPKEVEQKEPAKKPWYSLPTLSAPKMPSLSMPKFGFGKSDPPRELPSDDSPGRVKL